MKTITIVPINTSSQDGATINQVEDPVESEKLERAFKAEKRYNVYQEILHNSYTDAISIKVAFYGFGGVILGILANCVATLIPMHNVIEQPEYFLEFTLIALPGIPWFAAQLHMFLTYWMNTKCITTWKNFTITSVVCVIFGLALNIPMFSIWSGIYGYPFPMPFHTNIKALFVMLFSFVVLWYQFPLKFRENIKFKKRFKFFIYCVLLNFIMNLEYNVLGRVFSNVAKERQWIVAAILPLIREVNIWIHLKVAGKAADTNEDSSVIISSSHNINTKHTVILTIMLGTEATDLLESLYV